MPIPSLRVIENKPTKVESVSLEPKVISKPKNIKTPKVELSDNIKAFDEKPRVYTQNPFSHDYVAMNKPNIPTPPNKTAAQMLLDPTYNSVGKFLGLDNTKEWNKYYDRVYTIVEWAKEMGEIKDKEKIIYWIGEKSRIIPSMSGRKIDDLYVAARLYFTRERSGDVDRP
jgi:hypothetical protein